MNCSKRVIMSTLIALSSMFAHAEPKQEFTLRTSHFSIPFASATKNKKSIVAGSIVGFMVGMIIMEDEFVVDLPAMYNVHVHLKEDVLRLISSKYKKILELKEKVMSQLKPDLTQMTKCMNEQREWEQKHSYLVFFAHPKLLGLIGGSLAGIITERLVRKITLSDNVHVARAAYALQQQLYALVVMSYIQDRDETEQQAFRLLCDKLDKQCDAYMLYKPAHIYQSLIMAIKKDIADLRVGYTTSQETIRSFIYSLFDGWIAQTKLSMRRFAAYISGKDARVALWKILKADKSETAAYMKQLCKRWQKQHKIEMSYIQK